MPNTTLRGRLSGDDDESVVLNSAQQIDLLRLLAREYPDIARQEVD